MRRMTTTTACGFAALALLAAPSVRAEDELGGLGYTDLRLGVSTMPFSGFKGGPVYNPVTGDFDTSFRLSLTAMGPICGILPVGCATPPRLDKRASAAGDLAGSYENLAAEEGLTFQTAGVSYDLIAGFEFSFINMVNDGEINPLAGVFGNALSNPLQYNQIGGLRFGNLTPASLLLFGPGEPDIDLQAVDICFHLGWAFEVATRSAGRWQWEITGFGGAGAGVVDWTDGLSGESDDGSGIFYEIGARVGTYYTFRRGLQIGANVRYLYSDLDVELFDTGTDLSTSGLTFGLEFGWRF